MFKKKISAAISVLLCVLLLGGCTHSKIGRAHV